MKTDELIEIRWHGRGGQGAVTAAKLLAESAIEGGKFIQAFPEYGPERMGAPIKSFTRISPMPIRLHCQITRPHIVLVLDPTLLASVDIAEGLDKDGLIIVNTKESPAKIRRALGLKDKKIFTIDASGIALDTLGKNIPNTPMVAAAIKVSGILKLQDVLASFKNSYSKKFKDNIISANIDAMKRAYEEVKKEP